MLVGVCPVGSLFHKTSDRAKIAQLSRQPSHLGLRGIETSCNLIGLVHPEYVQKPVLNGEEVEKHVVELPGD